MQSLCHRFESGVQNNAIQAERAELFFGLYFTCDILGYINCKQLNKVIKNKFVGYNKAVWGAVIP